MCRPFGDCRGAASAWGNDDGILTAMSTTNSEITLGDAVSPASMRKVHGRLRDSNRKVRPTETRLIHDPIDDIAYSLDLTGNLAALSRRIVSGAYVPAQPATVRIAKRNRLRRPIVYCRLEDRIVLGSLVAAIRPSLEEELPDWVSYGGRSTGRVPPSGDPYESWFETFLRHHARADRIQQNDDPLMVLSDITNFFPSVNLNLLRDKMQRVSLLDNTATNLLFRILHELGGAHSFDPFTLRGLPQGPDGTSHLLANFLLVDVDQAFKSLGEANKFARLSDDMVFSASDQGSANRIISRLQDILERLGLAVNSSKTSVLTKAEFAATHLPEVNEELEAYESLSAGDMTHQERREFEVNARGFVKTTPFGEWDRVLRRYYTSARKLQSPVLAPFAWRHIESYPESAAHILEYMQTVRPTIRTLERLFDIAMTSSVYDDVKILCYETLLHMPLRNRARERDIAVQMANAHVMGSGCDPATPYVASLALLAIYKFGKWKDLDTVEELLSAEGCSLEVAKQGYVLLRSAGRSHDLSRSLPPRFNDAEFWRIAYFFDEIDRSPSTTLKVAEGWMRPKKSKNPIREFMRARSLPLYEMFSRRTPESVTFKRLVVNTRRRLDGVPERRLRDGISLARLQEIGLDSE